MTTVDAVPRRLLVGLALDQPEASASGPAATLSAVDARCVEQACWWAERAGGRLRLVHSLEIEPGRHADLLKPALQLARAEADERLQAVRQELSTRTDVPVEVGRVEGHAWRALLAEARRWQAEQIVLGPHLERGLLHALQYGSTTRRVLRTSPAPVWIVPPVGAPGLRRLLVPVDLSPVSAQLMDLADALHTTLGVERLLLHSLNFPADLSLRRQGDAAQAIARYHAEVRRDAEAAVDVLLEGRPAGWDVLYGRDWIVRDVPRVVDERDIDMVLLAGVSLPRLGALLGTTAERILDRVQRSVLVLKPAGWSPSPT